MSTPGSETKKVKFSELNIILLMIVAVVTWAFAFPFIKIGLGELSFVNLTIMRFSIVSFSFLILIAIFPKKFTKLRKEDVLPIFCLGFFGVMVYHLCLNYSEQYISPGAASLIVATSPIIIVILAVLFLKEKINLLKIFGIMIALLGVIIISILGEKEFSMEVKHILAAIAVFVAAIMTSIYTVAGKRLLERYSGLSLTAYAMLLGTAGLIPFLIYDSSIVSQASNMSSQAWFAVIFLGIFSTVIGYGIWYIILKIKSASELSIYLYAVPVLSTIISYFMLQEEITMFFVLGGFLVIIGLILVNKKHQKTF